MKRSCTMVLVLLLLALSLAACGGSTPAAPAVPTINPGGPSQSTTPAKLANTPLPTTEKASATTAAATTAPLATVKSATAEPQAAETLSLDSREAGLDKLKSYRMRWQAEWQSTDSAKPDSANWDWTEEFSSEPQALHWLWKVVNTADAKNQGDWEMWQIENTSYMAMTDEAGMKNCFSFSSDDKSQQITKGLFSPNSLGSVSNARFVGSETVNGIKAKHYKYSDSTGGLAGFGKVNGDLWVAVDAGFVVKDTMTWEGAAGLFGSATGSATGNGKWTWELSNVDQPLNLKPPENCGGAANDLPIMADATEKGSFGDMITYKSASKIADVTAFYQKAMPEAGWKAQDEPQISDTFAMLGFSKDTQKAQLMLTEDSGKTQVMITVTKE